MSLIHSTYGRFYHLDYLEFLDDPLGSNLLDDHLMICLPRTLAVRQEQLTKKPHLTICTGGIISQIVSAACQTLPFVIFLAREMTLCNFVAFCKFRGSLSKFSGITVLVATHTYLEKLHCEI
jgi:hypothetical protein